MKVAQRLLLLGCALLVVCLQTAKLADGQEGPPTANRVTQKVDESARVVLRGNVHPLARAENSQGAIPDSQPIGRILMLLRRSDSQEQELQALMEAQQDKSSKNFHAWLTPEQFGRQFGPSDADVQAVTDWLTSRGFQDVRVSAGRNLVEFSGTAGEVRDAFGTEMQNFQVNGAMFVANATDPQIPVALAPVVRGIVSLHNFPRKSHAKFRGTVQRDAKGGPLRPLVTFPDPFGSGGSFYGVGPSDFATIYNSKPLISAGNDGTGQTIAIVGETQLNPTDVSDFRAMFGLSNNFSSANVILNGMDPGITSQDEESEADLDVQWSGATAPGATIKFVVSASTPASAGVDLSALYIIEHNLADVMSESYGECEASLGGTGSAFYNDLWEQAAAQGITVIVSSGDNGSAGCDNFSANPPTPASKGLAVSGLASTPFNVSVGGTDFNQINTWSNYWNSTNDSVTGASAKSYIPETPWNESCAQLGLTGCGSTAPQGSINIVAGSGGPSKVNGKPKWQMGVNGVPNDSHRDQPDISLFASPAFTGSAYLYCQKDLTSVPACNLNSSTYTFQLIGGTSAAAPAFAGIMALVSQYAAAHGGTSRQGNANITLYALAKKSGASCASSVSEAANCIFNDVTSGNSYLATKYGKSVGTNSVPCKGGTLNCSSTIATTNGVLVDPSHTTTEAWTAAAGYDMATGLGSMNVNNLVTNWGSASTIATSTTLSLSPTTGITHGTNENVSVTVNVKPTSGTGVPTGDVALLATMSDGSTLGLDGFTLSNGSVSSVKTQSLPGGTYKVYAHYAGDGSNAPSDSSPVQVTVSKESSQTFIVIPTFDSLGRQTSGNASSVVYGSNYIIRLYITNSSATASASGPPTPTCETVNELTCPTGTVTLTADGNPVDGGTYTMNNNGYTRDIAPTLTGGTHSLVAKYSGDGSYAASTSNGSLTISPAPTQMTITGPGYLVVGTTAILQIGGGPGQGSGVAPTGTVTVYDGTALVAGPVAVSGGGGSQHTNPAFSAVAQVTFSTGGDHVITANYSGDLNYASTSATLTIHPLYSTTMSLHASSTNVSYGTNVSFTATVNTNQKNPVITGQIQLSWSDQLSSLTVGPTSQTADANGNVILQATATTTPQWNGYINAFYQGDTNYTQTSNDLFITVNIPDFTMSPASGLAVAPVAGQSGSGQITVTPASSTPSAVTLTLSPIVISGYSITLNPQTVSLNGSPASVMLVMTPVAGIATNSTKAHERRAFFFLFPKTEWPLSVVTATCALLLWFLSGRERSYRPALAFWVFCLLSLLFGCGGGSSYAPGGGGGGQTTPSPTTITLATSNAKVAAGAPFLITATVTGGRPLTGTVTFYNFGTAVAGGLSLTNSQAQTGQGYINNPGVYQITASYSGDANNLASTSAPLTQVLTGTFPVTIQGATGGDTHYISAAVGVQ